MTPRYEWIDFAGYRLRARERFLESKMAEADPRSGCGPGRLGNILVPDTILGVNIGPACRIHDYGWHVAEEGTDVDTDDIELFANGFRILKQKSSRLLLVPRAVILLMYLLAVVYSPVKPKGR